MMNENRIKTDFAGDTFS